MNQQCGYFFFMKLRKINHLGNICFPAVSTGKASLKNSGGSPGSCPVRTVTLMFVSGGEEVAIRPIL